MGGAASVNDTARSSVATLLICHSHQERHVRELLASVVSPGAARDVVVVTERFPRDLQARADMLSACQRAVVGVDPLFQTSTTLVDTLSFLKDIRKEIVAGPLTVFTRPSGAVGAICTAFGKWELGLFEDLAPLQAQVASSCTKLLCLSELGDAWDAPEELQQPTEVDKPMMDTATTSTSYDAGHLFFVYAGDDGHRVACAFDGLESKGKHIAGSSSLSRGDIDSDLQTLASARVVTFIITANCSADSSYRQLFEAALHWKKPILPINAGVRLGGWLQLAMAGRLWYQVDLDCMGNLHTPYSQIPNCPCRVSDSCLAADFIACSNAMLRATSQPGTSEAAQSRCREEALLAAARDKAVVHGLDAERVDLVMAQVHELVEATDVDTTKLEEWGVPMTMEAIETQRNESVLPFPMASELLPAKPENPELEFHDQHYEVTRQGIELPPSVLDANGLPIPNLQLDAMFSYQWGSQDVVLDVHMQGRVANLRAWFDVFGYMQGNVNAAMAAAVENVACVVVFLTQKYVESINCQLEFQYAARCRKPFILVLLCDISELHLPPWMTDVMGTDFSVYPTRVGADPAQDRVLALDYSADRVNGVPLTNVLFGAIRELAARRNRTPLSITYDSSLLLFATTSALRHAITTAASTTETAVSPEAPASHAVITCTRCGAAFHPSVPSSLQGCHQHSAYYMGGTLLAGRWMCCSETKQDGPGCQPTNHILEPRTWTCDPTYGTHKWQPQ